VGQPYTESSTTSSTSPPPGAIVAGIGGLVALIGVFLPWANVTTAFEGGQLGGQQFGGASQSVGATGISHWTGILALIAALVTLAVAVGVVVLQDPGTRRTAAIVAVGGGGAALVMAILGVVMSESIAVGSAPGGREALDFARQFADQLGLEGFRVDTGPAIGVFVTALGGAVAVAGGFLALRWVGPERVVPHREPLPPGTGFEAPTGPAGPQPSVPFEPPSTTPPGEPTKPDETTA
jgi:hypothetical protein